MKDTNDIEIKEGDNVVYISGYGTPYLKTARVIAVKDDKIKVLPQTGHSSNAVWLSSSNRIALYRDNNI